MGLTLFTDWIAAEGRLEKPFQGQGLKSLTVLRGLQESEFWVKELGFRVAVFGRKFEG